MKEFEIEGIQEIVKQSSKEHLLRINNLHISNDSKTVMLGTSIAFQIAIYLQNYPIEYRDEALEVLIKASKSIIKGFDKNNKKMSWSS